MNLEDQPLHVQLEAKLAYLEQDFHRLTEELYTKSEHPNGTDRSAETKELFDQVRKKLDTDIKYLAELNKEKQLKNLSKVKDMLTRLEKKKELDNELDFD